MADDRDKRRIITPPKGVEVLPVTSWEDATPAPVDPAEALHTIGRRVKITAQNAEATLENVGKLHAELAEMRLVSARNEGKLAEIAATLDEERKERRMYTAVGVSAYQAGVDLSKATALAKLDLDRNAAAAAIIAASERRAYLRQLSLKILAGVAVVWGAVSTFALARCH